MSVNENTLMSELNEALRNIDRNSVKEIGSITIYFLETGDIQLSAQNKVGDDFNIATVKLEASPEMKALAINLKEKIGPQIDKNILDLKDNLRSILLRAAAEV